VQLDAQLFTVFTLRDGRIVHLRDRARRTEALSDAGLDYALYSDWFGRRQPVVSRCRIASTSAWPGPSR
jgi:hypothetical protein